MRVSFQFESEVDEFFDHDALIAGLITGKYEWAIAYEIYPSQRKQITEIAIVPGKPGGHPTTHFIPHEAKVQP